MTTRMLPWLLGVAMAVCLVSDASAQRGSPPHPKLDSALAGGVDLDDNLRVIVQYRDGSGDRMKKRAEARGAKVRRQHAGTSAVTLEVHQRDIAALAADPDVLRISLDAEVRGNSKGSGKGGATDSQSRGKTKVKWPTSDVFDAQQLRQIVGLPPGLTGAGVRIAVIDSGIDVNEDVTIGAAVDFTVAGTPVMVDRPADGYGHGTHVAGLIGGDGTQSGGKYVGVAPGVTLHSFKVLDAEGKGYTSDVIEAIDTAIHYREDVDILNLSLGHPVFEAPATDPLVQAVERAVRAGLVVIVSAGNHGYDKETAEIGYAGITSPGNAPSAITVGSADTRATVSRLDDTVSRFSSRGPTWFDGRVKPDLLAPGNGLIAITSPTSKLYFKDQLRVDVPSYIRLSGTSMAAAVATGVAALVIEANRLDEGPGKPLTPNAVKAILQYTAIPLTDPDPSTPAVLEQGTGGINGAGAAALARAIEPATANGEWWLETTLPTSTVYDNSLYTWANQIVWGDHIVWGDSIFWSLSSWDEHIVWGDNVTWYESEHIVWGDAFDAASLVTESFYAWATQIVWGDNLVWGDAEHIVWGDWADEHIVWGDWDDEHIVWGDSLLDTATSILPLPTAGRLTGRSGGRGTNP